MQSFQLICDYANFDFYVFCSNAHDESYVIASTTAFHSKLKSARNSVIHTLVYSFELFHRHIIVSLLTMLASLTCFMIVIYKNLLFCCCPIWERVDFPYLATRGIIISHVKHIIQAMTKIDKYVVVNIYMHQLLYS